MRSLWILFAVLGSAPPALASYSVEPVSSPGTITGRVTYSGPPPALPAEQRDRNPEICGSTHDNQTLEVGPQQGLRNAIVYLADVASGKALIPVTAQLDQKGCTYVPHVQAVPVGSTLEILNDDPLLHNIHALAGGSTAFNYAMPQSVKRIPKHLTKAGFLSLKCDVHAWMNGTVAVMANPYFAVVDDQGRFTIDGIPPGTYTLHAWHERLGEQTQSVVVTPGGSSTVAFSFSGR